MTSLIDLLLNMEIYSTNSNQNFNGKKSSGPGPGCRCFRHEVLGTRRMLRLLNIEILNDIYIPNFQTETRIRIQTYDITLLK